MRGLGRSVAAASTALLLLVTGGVGAAMAAPPYATTATVTNIQFVNNTVTSGSSAEMTADWTLPDNPSSPAGFTIALPPELAGRGDTFTIKAQDTGATIATCVAQPTQLVCDFDSAYISDNSRNLKGNVNFWVKVNKTVTQTQEETFEVGGQTVKVNVSPSTETCGTNCDFVWNYKKDGSYDYAKDEVDWYVHVEAPLGGMAGGLNVEVRDTPGPNQELIVNDSTPELQRTNEIGPRPGDGATRPINWQLVPRSEYTVDPTTGVVKFTTQQGYYYQVEYRTKVTNPGQATEYTNTAEFAINGQTDGSANGLVRYAGGGGTGIGENVGVFQITKKVEGNAVNLPADLKFTGDYVVNVPDSAALTGSFEVAANGTWKSPEFPRGSTVTLMEVKPTSPANIAWGEPTFSQNNFTLEGGKLAEVVLTNKADVKVGNFSAAKSLEGTAGALDLVPSDAQFVLDYSYPAGVGFPAGSGTLTVGADGKPVTSGDLPVGANVTVTEQTPAPVEGLAWGKPVISPENFTVADGTAVEVKVTNPVTETLGGFSLKKSVSGGASGLVPEGTLFTVDYTWTTDDGKTGSGTVEVPAGGDPVTVEGVPAGAVVTLTEKAADPIAGVDWLDPVFSENGFTVLPGTVIAIDLDNPTQLRQGAIGIRKAIEGNGSTLIPADTQFTVEYSYPAGTGFEAGSGEIVVRADGVVVQSDPIPYGATVTLKELTPGAVPGVTWTGGTFDIENVTAGDGTVQNVVLTNTYEKTPEKPTKPTTPTTPEKPAQPGLPVTGAEDGALLGLAGVAGLMLAAGVTLMARKRIASRR
ncbi:hypothetical protein JD292_05780 [Leucobacter sp. CSA2]|uniref:Gram-positive cocci surface proteins LPxTG domain-containing protein n=1 Tax=Leucobacter edaphi TaxID=2796472 RepID=A0A934UXQ6_9MICO|nr:DUF5979 domain-containing protein [Leucobacter edaphi]MBK0421578.1 hypothetical protein [Leucobacter edaphi]